MLFYSTLNIISASRRGVNSAPSPIRNRMVALVTGYSVGYSVMNGMINVIYRKNRVAIDAKIARIITIT